MNSYINFGMICPIVYIQYIERIQILRKLKTERERERRKEKDRNHFVSHLHVAL